MCVVLFVAHVLSPVFDRLDADYDATNETQQEEALLFLLDRGGEASPPSDLLDTPLHYAAAQVRYGCSWVGKFILRSSVPAHFFKNVRSSHMPSYLFFYTQHIRGPQGQDQAVVRLLQKGADPHAHNFQVPFHVSIIAFEGRNRSTEPTPKKQQNRTAPPSSRRPPPATPWGSGRSAS